MLHFIYIPEPIKWHSIHFYINNFNHIRLCLSALIVEFHLRLNRLHWMTRAGCTCMAATAMWSTEEANTALVPYSSGSQPWLAPFLGTQLFVTAYSHILQVIKKFSWSSLAEAVTTFQGVKIVSLSGLWAWGFKGVHSNRTFGLKRFYTPPSYTFKVTYHL